jgi:hypothetical protein
MFGIRSFSEETHFNFSPEGYETKQIFLKSKDGTRTCPAFGATSSPAGLKAPRNMSLRKTRELRILNFKYLPLQPVKELVPDLTRPRRLLLFRHLV